MRRCSFRCTANFAAWIAAWTIIELTTKVNNVLPLLQCNRIFKSMMTSRLVVTPFADSLLRTSPSLPNCRFSGNPTIRSVSHILKSGPIPPPQRNIHGWDSHPTILHGYWNVISAPSSEKGITECNYFVLKKNGKLKTGGKTRSSTHLWPRGWAFTPANRRLIVEIDVLPDSPYFNIKPMTLRYSFKMKRVPVFSRKGTGRITLRFAVGCGNVKVRPCDGTTLPSTKGQNHSWPLLGDNVCIKRNALSRGSCDARHNQWPAAAPFSETTTSMENSCSSKTLWSRHHRSCFILFIV